MIKLNKQGITDFSQVFLATYNKESGLHIDLYNDHIKGDIKRYQRYQIKKE